MGQKKSNSPYINYQERAKEFSVGDIVITFPMGSPDQAGRVTALYPAIGMADVQYPHGNKRLPVEGLQRTRGDFWVQPPRVDSTLGGNPKTPVTAPSPEKVASAHLKQALYWKSLDRKYRATQSEVVSKNYSCPRCKIVTLKKCVYKRQEGASEKLFGCPQCLFLIKRSDIEGCHLNQCDVPEEELI